MSKQSSYKLSGIGTVIGFVFGLSGIINILALTGAFYMLQIYDRALTSGSIPTLIWLSVIAVGLYLFQGMFDILRSQMLVRFGSNVDRKIAPLVHRVVIDMPRFGYSSAEASERGRDVDTVRGFLSGAGPVALFDLPWIPVYLVFVWMLHPVLGMLTLGGAAFLACLTPHEHAVLTSAFRRLEAEARAVLREVFRLGVGWQRFTTAERAEIVRAKGEGT